MLGIIVLVFFAYRVYKTAKETGRNAVGWTASAVGAYIGIQLAVGIGFGIVVTVGQELWGWTEDTANRYYSIASIVAGILGIVCVVVISNYVGKVPEEKISQPSSPPPPPPTFN